MRFVVRRNREVRPTLRLCRLCSADCRGSVVAEFALGAPIMLLLTAAIADFGLLTRQSAALTGATRIGAEYARFHSSDAIGIKNSMQNSMNFSPPLSFPANFTQSCECDDGTSITCGTTCVGAGKVPNRVLVTVTASQAYTPILSWPMIPTSLTASTEIRIQ